MEVTVNHGKNIDKIQEKDPNTNDQVFSVLTNQELTENIRYNEMKMLFSKKPYTEGLVLSENHLRGYIRLEAFSFLSEENQNELLKEVEKYFSELKNAIIFYNIENEVFLSIEPLLHSIEKERLKEMTDFIIQEIENLGE